MRQVIHMKRPQQIPVDTFMPLIEIVEQFAKNYGTVLNAHPSPLALEIQPTPGSPVEFRMYQDLSGAPFNPRDRVYDLISYACDRNFGVAWVAVLLWMAEYAFPNHPKGSLSVWCEDETILEEGSHVFERVLSKKPVSWEDLAPSSP